MFTSARFQLDVLSCVSGDVKYERMELTTSVLCWAGSSLEFLRANWPLRCGEFDQTAFRDVIGRARATDVARDDETKSSLSMFAGMWEGVGGRGPQAVGGASPVDLHGEADHRTAVFQPLDGKSQADSQLGSGYGEEGGKRKTCDGTKRTVETERDRKQDTSVRQEQCHVPIVPS